MANIIQYDPNDAIVPYKVIAYLLTQHTPNFTSGNYVINPDLSGLSGIDMIYWKVSGSDVVEMTAQEKTDIDADIAAQAAQAEADAKDFTVSYDKLDKAFALTVLDEVNVIRTWLRDFKTETAASTSLANFQSRVAALGAMLDRTQSQLKTAVSNKYDTL